MSASSHVILVEPYPARLDELGAHLRRCGCHVSSYDDIVKARPLLALNLPPALIIIDERCGIATGANFIAEVRRLAPASPILWVGEIDVPPQAFHGHPPDRCSTSEPGASIQAALELLRPRLYPDAFIDFVCAEYDASLRALFGESFELSEPALESAYSTIAGVSAMISFAGPGLSGWILVSGSFSVMAELARMLIPGAGSLRDASDIAGEIANQLLGRVKAFLLAAELDVTLGSPVYLSGEMIRVRYPSPRPSLTLAMRSSAGQLWSELHIDGVLPADATAPSPGLRRGELNFF